MVGIAQSAERRIVVPVVAGSSPVAHPKPHQAGKQPGARTWSSADASSLK